MKTLFNDMLPRHKSKKSSWTMLAFPENSNWKNNQEKLPSRTKKMIVYNIIYVKI